MPILTEWIVFFVGIAMFVFAVVTLVINVKGSKRTSIHEIEERVKDSTKINTKLDDMLGISREIKDDVNSVKKEMQSHNDRIIKVEESLKSVHKRVDGIEIRLNKQDGE